MDVSYRRDTDVLVVRLRDAAVVDVIEQPGGVIVSYGADGAPVSVEFRTAARRGLISPNNLTVTVTSTI
jgi:uncharacterized protein YuzE